MQGANQALQMLLQSFVVVRFEYDLIQQRLGEKYEQGDRKK